MPGHQVVGRVVRVGDAVSGWAVGDRAGVAWLAATCGVCRFCTSGRENLCADARFTGWDRDGGYATRIAVRADFALRLPDGFDDLAAAPLLCGGVIGYRSLKVSGIQPGGASACSGSARRRCSPSRSRATWAAGSTCGRARRGAAACARVRRGVGGRLRLADALLDAAITFAPAGDVVVAALRNVDRGGTVAINAIHLDRIPEFSYDLLWLERSLRSVANFTRADAREFLELAAAIPIRTAIETFPLEAGNDALHGLATGGLEGTAVLTIGDG